MTQGHLHYYFPSKNDLLLELLDRLILILCDDRQNLLNQPNMDARSKIISLFETKMKVIHGGAFDLVLFDFWVQSAGNAIIREKMQAIFYLPWRNDIDEVVQEGVENGEFGPEFAALVPSFLISLMDGAALQYLIDNEAFDIQEYLRVAGEMIFKFLEP